MSDPGVRNLRAAEVKLSELVQSLDVFQTGIRDTRAVESQDPKAVQSLEMFQAGIRDLRQKQPNFGVWAKC